MRSVSSQGWDVDKICAERHCQHLLCRQKAKFARQGALKSSLATFAEYLGQPPNPGRGYYALYLKRFLSVFDRSQIMILNFERLIYNTTDTMSRLAKFLDLPHDWGSNVTLPHDNAAKVAVDMDCGSRDVLAEAYREANQQLYSMLIGPRALPGAPRDEPPFFEFPDTSSYVCTAPRVPCTTNCSS